MLGILANLPYIANAIELRNGLNQIGLRQTIKIPFPASMWIELGAKCGMGWKNP
jgi:hypothetical protein